MTGTEGTGKSGMHQGLEHLYIPKEGGEAGEVSLKLGDKTYPASAVSKVVVDNVITYQVANETIISEMPGGGLLNRASNEIILKPADRSLLGNVKWAQTENMHGALKVLINDMTKNKKEMTKALGELKLAMMEWEVAMTQGASAEKLNQAVLKVEVAIKNVESAQKALDASTVAFATSMGAQAGGMAAMTVRHKASDSKATQLNKSSQQQAINSASGMGKTVADFQQKTADFKHEMAKNQATMDSAMEIAESQGREAEYQMLAGAFRDLKSEITQSMNKDSQELDAINQIITQLFDPGGSRGRING
jgi:hypothetical protein